MLSGSLGSPISFYSQFISTSMGAVNQKSPAKTAQDRPTRRQFRSTLIDRPSLSFGLKKKKKHKYKYKYRINQKDANLYQQSLINELLRDRETIEQSISLDTSDDVGRVIGSG